MKLFLTIIIISFVTLIINGCCSTHDCASPIGFFKIRILQDGKNVLYGPDAILTKSSIHLTTDSSLPGQEDYILFNDSNETIEFGVHEYAPAFLKLSSIRTDTFTITTEAGPEKCGCANYTVTSVSRNGVIICTGLCEDVIVIEL